MKTIGQIAGARLPRRLTARLAGMGAAPGALVWQPAPPVAGDPAVARRLVNGVLLFDGRLVETSAPVPWGLAAPDEIWESELHGHGWLDHAAASDHRETWTYLANWLWTWLDAYGDGAGPGWRPDLVARRLTRWIAHSVRLLNGLPSDQSARFFRALGLQTRYLDWRWSETAPGLPRVEALAGLVYARLSLEGPGRETDRAIADLGREAARTIGPNGEIASRSPEALARILSVLAWSHSNIEDAGRRPAQGHAAAIQRGLPVLKALTHPSGALARFHGGRPGADLPLDEITRAAGPGLTNPQFAPMGYRRLSQGAAVLIADCAMPPDGGDAATAHASPLAFEFSHGAFPMIVNSGTGLGFGAKAARTARRLGAHSTLELGETCPANVKTTAAGPAAGPTLLSLTGAVSARMNKDQNAAWLLGESTHYVETFGLHTERRLRLAADGETLDGEDTVLATTAETRGRVASMFPEGRCAMRLRLHLHPDIQAGLALNGRAISLKLPDGGLWMFSADADALDLMPSRYFDEDRPKPRATSQIVASSEVLEYWGRITWSLKRLPDGDGPLRMRAARGG